jgi:hypothetical protein
LIVSSRRRNPSAKQAQNQEYWSWLRMMRLELLWHLQDMANARLDEPREVAEKLALTRTGPGWAIWLEGTGSAFYLPELMMFSVRSSPLRLLPVMKEMISLGVDRFGGIVIHAGPFSKGLLPFLRRWRFETTFADDNQTAALSLAVEAGDVGPRFSETVYQVCGTDWDCTAALARDRWREMSPDTIADLISDAPYEVEENREEILVREGRANLDITVPPLSASHGNLQRMAEEALLEKTAPRAASRVWVGGDAGRWEEPPRGIHALVKQVAGQSLDKTLYGERRPNPEDLENLVILGTPRHDNPDDWTPYLLLPALRARNPLITT